MHIYFAKISRCSRGRQLNGYLSRLKKVLSVMLVYLLVYVHLLLWVLLYSQLLRYR